MEKSNAETPDPCDLTTLEDDIRSRLTGRVSRFRLLVREHGVVLQGYALTYYAKQWAEQAVNESAGLSIEANEIRVYQDRKPERPLLKARTGR